MPAACDCAAQEIAEHLKISANTVKTHISGAMRKLNVKNRKYLKQYMLLQAERPTKILAEVTRFRG